MSHHSYYPVSRFLRVLFSVIFCLFASLVISALLWIPVDEGHYTHRAAIPFFMFMLFESFFAGFVIALSSLLFWFDRRALHGKQLSAKQSSLLLSVVVLGVLSGYYHFLFGAAFLFILLYWAMTGRVAGRQGWSASGFLSTKWDEKLYLIAMVILFAPMVLWLPSNMLYSVLPVKLGTPDFRVRYEHQMNFDVKRALHRFPDAQSCLERGAKAANRKDLVRMDWDKISTNGDAKVCAFRLLHEWGGVAEAAAWLETQGFRVGEVNNSDAPFVDSGGTLRVDGAWSIRKNGPRFPASGVIRRISNALPYGMSVSATYDPDGQELLYVDINFSTL